MNSIDESQDKDKKKKKDESDDDDDDNNRGGGLLIPVLEWIGGLIPRRMPAPITPNPNNPNNRGDSEVKE